MLNREADLKSTDGHVFNCKFPSTYPSTFSGSPPFAWIRTVVSPKAKVSYYTWQNGSQSLGELLEGIYGISPQTINHLIATGPKLEGNTLHIKVSSFEWMAILWLNWFTCSTGSIQPLYMVNVGGWNRRGSLALSILRVKGDLEIWFNALLIALLPKPLWGRLLYLRLWWYFSS